MQSDGVVLNVRSSTSTQALSRGGDGLHGERQDHVQPVVGGNAPTSEVDSDDFSVSERGGVHTPGFRSSVRDLGHRRLEGGGDPVAPLRLRTGCNSQVDPSAKMTYSLRQ
jgi:hypothetical protein